MTVDDVIAAAQWLRDATAVLDPGPPVETIYRPLEYAWDIHEDYLTRFGGPPKQALFVGMNPGPWGMGQTGVPFGDPTVVGRWLKLTDHVVEAPEQELPQRPVRGLDSTHTEVSGQRLWGLLRDLYTTPQAALEHLLVVNHCPLLMFDIQHRNVTPDQLRVGFRENLLEVCDNGLQRMTEATGAGLLIGVGDYAYERCKVVAGRMGIQAAAIAHPSPANPLANKHGGKDWRKGVEKVLASVKLA